MWLLQVLDYRKVNTAQEMFQALLEHIKFATNNGNLRWVFLINGNCSNFVLVRYPVGQQSQFFVTEQSLDVIFVFGMSS